MVLGLACPHQSMGGPACRGSPRRLGPVFWSLCKGSPLSSGPLPDGRTEPRIQTPMGYAAGLGALQPSPIASEVKEEAFPVNSDLLHLKKDTAERQKDPLLANFRPNPCFSLSWVHFKDFTGGKLISSKVLLSQFAVIQPVVWLGVAQGPSWTWWHLKPTVTVRTWLRSCAAGSHLCCWSGYT